MEQTSMQEYCINQLYVLPIQDYMGASLWYTEVVLKFITQSIFKFTDKVNRQISRLLLYLLCTGGLEQTSPLCKVCLGFVVLRYL